MHSYHIYAEYLDYNKPRIFKSINTVVDVKEKILTKSQYDKLRKFIVDDYYLKISEYEVEIKSLTYLGSDEPTTCSCGE